MPDEKDFPIDADNFADEVEIEFIDAGDEEVVEGETKASPEETAEVQVVAEPPLSEVEQLRAEVEHVRDVYLRKLAEFDNFRKRVERERDEHRRAGAEEFIAELLPVIDNFDRALQHSGDDSGAFREGVEMISKQLADLLDRRGVAEINPVGLPFDPEVHEAVQRVENSEHEPGTVAWVMLKGYRLGDRLIRPAMVGVAVEPESGGGGEGEAS